MRDSSTIHSKSSKLGNYSNPSFTSENSSKSNRFHASSNSDRSHSSSKFKCYRCGLSGLKAGYDNCNAIAYMNIINVYVIKTINSQVYVRTYTVAQTSGTTLVMYWHDNYCHTACIILNGKRNTHPAVTDLVISFYCT